MRRIHCALAACLCWTPLGAAALHAQSAAPSALQPRTDRAAADDDGWHVEQCMAGVTYGAPLKLALSYGMGLLHESNTGPDVCALAVAKVGLGGAQGSLGMGTSFAPWGSGVMVTGNVLRTFGSPLKATPRRTYIGASLHLWPVLALGGELGYFVRMGDKAGESTGGRRVIAWSAGFGF
jgi:hypothetical protein